MWINAQILILFVFIRIIILFIWLFIFFIMSLVLSIILCLGIECIKKIKPCVRIFLNTLDKSIAITT